ncbi:hypothetical protein LUX12_05630 [Streptomyces somaliensis]|uniref:hypothetical protein n=1 Tax=Streptomyces somaliensis TaxID=78355 RepID=UPI0020CCB0A8|nr:hypothetical protein [Streptomyces somaliensis]MCP9944386.1 hypothetical protein [Streptomyces somaliensis]MCP9962380.1 hypothetical protein [Streptomyces somaliensis]MCP9975198.1 hypothetical protein [Streptomyces somaliensis]
MAWDEWEQLKAEASERLGNRTRLNGVGEGPGAPVVLKSDATAKAGAIKALNEAIRPRTGAVGGGADQETDTAEREFAEWATGAGLRAAHDEWRRQVENLKRRLEADEAALSGARRDLRHTDVEVMGRLSAVSQPTALDDGRRAR